MQKEMSKIYALQGLLKCPFPSINALVRKKLSLTNPCGEADSGPPIVAQWKQALSGVAHCESNLSLYTV